MNGFTIPTDFDRITLVAALLLVLALAAMITGVVHVFTRRRISLFRIGSGLVLLLVGLAIFAVAGWAQTYRALTHNELVATVRASNVPGQAQTMQVVYTPIANGHTGTPQTFTIKGDEWQLGGDIIKWEDWVNILGVNTGYRVTRIMGYFQDPNDYKIKRVSAYNLTTSSDTVSTFLRDHSNLMPFVRATYGNDVRMLPNAGTTYKVYVSTSGYWAAQ